MTKEVFEQIQEGLEEALTVARREKATVTDEMVEAAETAYWDRSNDPEGSRDMHAALTAALAQAETQPVAWQPMETAPKGEVTEDAGCRGTSEWFLGRVSKEFRKVGAAPFVVIRRRAWPQEDSWACNGEAHYVPRYFDAWMPLSTSSTPADGEDRAAPVANLQGLTTFAKAMIQVAFQGGDISGADIQGLGVQHGLLSCVPFDPEKHKDPEGYAEEGDYWYVYAGPLATTEGSDNG